MNEEYAKVEPTEFYIEIKGRKRRIRFGNRTLAEIEKRYGSVQDFKKLQEDIQKKPMENIPWLLSICMKDKEDIGTSNEEILDALDESNISVRYVLDVIAKAMNDSMSNIFGGASKKKGTKKTN